MVLSVPVAANDVEAFVQRIVVGEPIEERVRLILEPVGVRVVVPLDGNSCNESSLGNIYEIAGRV